MAQLLFTADDGFAGRELWTTDGSMAGTRLLADIWGGGGPGSPFGITPLGDGRALFAATDPEHGNEPWVTDGTTAGTQLLRDINTERAGYFGSGPSGFTAIGQGRAVFSASDAERGSEVWVTDGTRDGTQPLELVPGPGGASVAGPFMPVGGGRVVFSANTPELGYELWITDGTEAGTRLVEDINPGTNGSFPGGYYGQRAAEQLDQGRVVFAADDGTNGRELWASNGTAEGTYLVADLWPGGYTPPYEGAPEYPFSSSPANFTQLVPGLVLFTATNQLSGNELWVTDGTEEGTRLVLDIDPRIQPSPPYAPPGGGSNPGSILALGNGLALFSAEDPDLGRELWVTDGTPEGTRRLADIWDGGGGGTPGGATQYGGPPYGPYGPYGPYYPYPPYGQPSGPGGIVLVEEGKALFSATDPRHGTELWASDGTEEGTRLVLDINRNQQGFASSTPSYFAALGDGRAIFTADDGVNGPEPWISDGTPEGTMLLRDTRSDPVPPSGGPPNLPSGYVLISAPGTVPGGPSEGLPPDAFLPLGAPQDEVWGA